MRPRWAWIRAAAGAGTVAVLLWRFGGAAFVAGLRQVDGAALAAAVGLGALTTACGAWRWCLVARGLGLQLSMRTAVARCYGSVFLNATLPGGVLGDVDRAVRHGRDAGDVGRGLRAVVWERTAGQVVQAVIAVAVLAVFPSPVRRYVPAALVLVVVFSLVAFALVRASRVRLPSRWAGALRVATADIRNGLLARGNWLGIAAASTMAVAGYVATFVVAARAAGATAPLPVLVPLVLLALLAMGVPANVAGFGPREGAAAWAFAGAGLTAGQGVASSVVFAVLVLVASLPGAVVLLMPALAGARAPQCPRSPAPAFPGARKISSIMAGAAQDPADHDP